jgi:hypothetical protein
LSKILGALKNSQLIKKSLIDHYVPFLPLEEAHVKKCIQDYIEENDHLKLNKRQINCIISYIPVRDKISVHAHKGNSLWLCLLGEFF